MQLKIGIVSDFHCHNKSNNSNVRESYILTDEDFPVFQNPLKSFKVLISENKDINVDILMMPGDFANRSDLEGLKLGWNITKEIGKLLKAKLIIPNVGNHDVDSRKKFGDDAFEHIKALSKDFPFQNHALNAFFWEKGYVIIEETNYRVLIINSVHSHVNETEAEHGLVSQEAINELEKKYESFHDSKLNIAMVHHNPLEHSRYNTGSKDYMYNGDELISILDKFNFDIIVHGHKHDPRIRYAPGGGNSPVIFSAGSFCAFSNLLLQGAHNTFHIITLEVQEDQVGKGIIDTWFFIPTKGWKQEVKSDFFESTIGFGAVVDLKLMATEILKWFKSSDTSFVEWVEFIKRFPDLQFIIPSDFAKLKADLKKKNILISPKVINEAVFVQYKPI